MNNTLSKEEIMKKFKRLFDDSNVDFGNVDQMASDVWLFLTSDKMPARANIKKDALIHEVKAMIECARQHYAKQESRREAIEFTYWHRGSIAQIYMPNGDGTWDIVKPSQKPVEYEKITDDQLYDLYLLHKQNKEQ